MNRLPKFTTVIIILVSVAFLSILYQPSSKVKAADQEEENINSILNIYYLAIIDQNFGLAEKYYKIPVIGPMSNIGSYNDLNSPIEYFEFLYSQSNYIIEDHEIIKLEKLEPDKYHARIKLLGYQEEDNQSIDFNQDVLISLNESNEWIISLEDYPAYMKSLIESKDINDLSGVEVIYRFFIEIDKGNYKAAARFINPSMSNIDGNTDEIIPYLKNWHEDHMEVINHISSSRIYILKDFEITKEDSIFLISSQPIRNDSYLRKFGTPFSCNPCSTPIHSFFEINHEEGGYLLNIEDADKKISRLLTKFPLWLEFLFDNLVYLCLLLAFLCYLPVAISRRRRRSILGSVSVSVSNTEEYMNSSIKNTRNKDTRDIATSVDYLLNRNTSAKETSKKNQEKKLPITSTETRRTIHISHNNEPNDYDKNSTSDVYSRKIYTDDE